MAPKFTTVDEYELSLPESTRPILRELRRRSKVKTS